MFKISFTKAGWLCSLLLICACSEEVTYVSNPHGKDPTFPQTPISFKSRAYDANSTKAQVIDGDNISSFKVSANLPRPSSVEQTSEEWSAGFNFFEDVNVQKYYYGEWSPAPTVYWPNVEDTITFYAYSPAESANVTADNGFTSDMTTGRPTKDNASLSYTVPNTPDGKAAEDLLFAVTKRSAETVHPTSVMMDFRHALSMVTFSARNTSSDIVFVVEKVELINLRNQASLDLSQNFASDSVYWSPTPVDKTDYVSGLTLQNSTYHPITLPPLGSEAKYISLTGPTEQTPILPQGFIVGDRSASTVKSKPTEPGVLLTFMAYTSRQNIQPSGAMLYIPFPALYEAPDYGGKPDRWGDNPNNNAFAFQMGNRYDFRLDFNGADNPHIEFSCYPIGKEPENTIDMLR
jgi:hypothetical protein